MKRQPYRPWTLEEEAKLRQCWKEGLRGPALAEVMGRSESALKNRSHILSLRHLS